MKRAIRGVFASAMLAVLIAGGVVYLTSPTMARPRPGNCSGQFCGGIAGIPCPEGYTCVDNPCDSCNPKTGGADCGGLCRR